jgi:hypothetical protein
LQHRRLRRRRLARSISHEAYSAPLAEIALAIVIESFTNLFNPNLVNPNLVNAVNDTDIDLPRAA